MPLHIFEPRYRAMLSDCLAGDRRFGLIYHDWDLQGPFLCETGRVGCVAEVLRHHPLEDGRSFIIVEGVERFSIGDGIESESLYFEALVSPYADGAQPGPAAMASRRSESIRLFHALVASLDPPPEHVPELEPDAEVSFALAQAVQGDPAWHQGLLELRDEVERLDRVDLVFKAALA